MMHSPVSPSSKNFRTAKHLGFGWAIFFCFCSTAHADQLYLKSGEMLKGRVTAVHDASYTFVSDPENKTMEIPLANVAIADIDPSNPAAKSRLILFSTSSQKKSAPEEDKPSHEGGGPLVMVPAGDPKAEFKKSGDVLKFAEDTVALSNARTAESQKQIEGLKQIADSSNEK